MIDGDNNGLIVRVTRDLKNGNFLLAFYYTLYAHECFVD